MSGDLLPDDLRSRRFTSARRGYDRDEVDAFAGEVADAVASLQAELRALEERVEAMGGGGADARAELDAVGEDVARILESARQAAENMRTRASEDAARWRSDADTEARRLRETSRVDAEAARGAAWDTGTELLEHAQSRSDEIVRLAEQDALFIRAEAEREALRLTGDARRDGEEVLRAARAEAEELLGQARSESESSRAAAQEAVDAAQERARALELRRVELLEELEAARASIGGLTSQEAEDSTIRVLSAPEAQREADTWTADWVDDDATVRLLDPSTLPAMEPVDADELVAEVEQLRRGEAAVAVAQPTVVVTVDDRADPDADLEVAADSNGGGQGPDGDEAAAAATDETEEVAVPVVGAAVAEAGTHTDAEPEHASNAAADPEPEVVEPAVTDGIDQLFASLREPAESNGQAAPAAEEAAAAQSQEEMSDGPTADVSPNPDEESASPVAPVVAMVGDPFELREKLLLPIENRALRTIKRRLVDLQNRVLEDLRVSQAEWEPDRAMIAASFADELKQLARESLVAGYGGAADLIGSASTPQPSGGDPSDASDAFVRGLVEAIAEALQGARKAGSGTRQVAAAVSRVFRAWRTDEAERRVRMAAFAAYHEGIARSLDALGVDQVRGEARKKACPQCAPGLDRPWGPGEPAELPPMHVDCECTLVPA